MSLEQTKPVVYLSDVEPPPKVLSLWERRKHSQASLIVQFIAEATGTFMYTYPGVGATAAWLMGNTLQITNLGSGFQIGMGYSVGVAMALIICLPTSRGHLNPAFTIYSILMRKCSVQRGFMLIVAQILGSYIACLLIYLQYHNLISPVVAGLKAKGEYDAVMFTPQGPAGILALYANPTANLGYIFLNEFVCDFFIAIVIVAGFDPTNRFCPPAVMPWMIGLSYGIMIWGFAGVGLSANSARDIGGRIAALSIWGMKAGGGHYAAIAALTNIPATIAGGLFYEFVLGDHSRTISDEHCDIITANKAHEERIRSGGALAFASLDGMMESKEDAEMGKV
ncbi:aquaporin-like protein [Sparassis latifolia]|uniref:Aquaporin-like protein n=1 Tax=Sparassis crispa TaxID=139825 RepID=A0A401GSU5_9APHY|nr:predicted protein [Sparassis crispa]GBE85302.1 predicted protein [Sparassis crispa]